MIVAAGGALIDQFNGGRLHPEQWLGAAALVCGVGLLVGVVRGRAWWLIVPALLFAGTGYVAGLMSRLGIDAVDTFGDQSLYVSDTTPGGTATLQSGIGTIWITVDGAPADPLTIDARTALGPIEVRVVDDVAIEIRSESDSGDLIVDGVVASGGVIRLGPDRPPDVIVDARQGIGDVVVWTYFPDARVPVKPPVRTVPDVATRYPRVIPRRSGDHDLAGPCHHDRRLTMRSHPFDPVSAVLAFIALVAGILVDRRLHAAVRGERRPLARRGRARVRHFPAPLEVQSRPRTLRSRR